MNILLVTGESLPYCKSGGLGDFIWSYSKALAKLGEHVSVILPLYDLVIAKHPEAEKEVYDRFDFHMSERTKWATITKTENEGVDFYFVRMDEFKTMALYGYPNDNERFASFTMAVNTFLTRHNDYDVVHCNDWQTAVLPLLLRYNPKTIKTVLTIHNPAYQGWGLRGDLSYFFNLDLDYYDSGFAKLGDSFNFLKTGIMAADKVNTVSPTQARELVSDHEAFGGIGAILDWCRHNGFSGIVNGLDTEVWNPKTDPVLPENYGSDNAEEAKKKARRAILAYLDMDLDFKGPLYGVITRLSAQKGIDRIIRAMDGLHAADGRMIIIGTGELESEVMGACWRHPEVYLVNKYDENLAHLLYAASDYFLMPSYFEPCGTGQLISMRYGTLPIVSNVGGLADTVKDLGSGEEATGFVFNGSLPDAIYNTVLAANDLFYNNRKRFAELQKKGMSGEYGWAKSAKEYLSLYDSISWK